MSASICLESAVTEMRVRVKRLRDEAERIELEGQSRHLREIAAMLEQAMWDTEEAAGVYRRRYGGEA